MSKIIVYPNNTVSINGEEVHWTVEEFLQRKIDKIRKQPREVKSEGYRLKVGENEIFVFYTHITNRQSIKKRIFNNPFGPLTEKSWAINNLRKK